MPLFNLPKTAQEIYDTVAEHMLKQNQRSTLLSIAGYDACAYRGMDGLKCAAGCLIPEEIYQVIFEGYSWPEMISDFDFPKDHWELITKLQNIHDHIDPKNWRKGLTIIANSYSLNTDVLNNI